MFTHQNTTFYTVVEGSFEKFDGSVVAVKPDFTDAKISFIVDVNCISNDVEQLNTHLKSDDFLMRRLIPT